MTLPVTTVEPIPSYIIKVSFSIEQIGSSPSNYKPVYSIN